MCVLFVIVFLQLNRPPQEEALADCLEVLALFNEDPALFCWEEDDIAMFFREGPGQGARKEVVQQQNRGLPLPQDRDEGLYCEAIERRA